MYISIFIFSALSIIAIIYSIIFLIYEGLIIKRKRKFSKIKKIDS